MKFNVPEIADRFELQSFTKAPFEMAAFLCCLMFESHDYF